MTKLIVAPRNFTKAPEKGKVVNSSTLWTFSIVCFIKLSIMNDIILEK